LVDDRGPRVCNQPGGVIANPRGRKKAGRKSSGEKGDVACGVVGTREMGGGGILAHFEGLRRGYREGVGPKPSSRCKS